MICKCSKEEFNTIASNEGSRGRAQFSKPDRGVVIGYRISSDSKPEWLVDTTCPSCDTEMLSKLKAARNNNLCRSCANSQRNIKWDIQDQLVYRKWKRMMARCYSISNYKYDRYGARGIVVCEDWHDYDNYQAWVLSKGKYIEGTHIDRINNDGNYEPDNCQLLTCSEHSTKTSNNRWSAV